MDDVSRAIGALESSVKAIKEGQVEVTGSVRSMEDDISVVKQDVAVIKVMMQDIAPSAKKINNWEQRMLGIGMLVASGGGIAALVLTRLRDWILS